MTEAEVRKLVGLIEDRYDEPIDDERFKRWERALAGEDGYKIGLALRTYMDDEPRWPPKPQALIQAARAVPAPQTGSSPDPKGTGLRSGADEHGAIIQEHSGCFLFVPKAQIRNHHVDMLKAAMQREGNA